MMLSTVSWKDLGAGAGRVRAGISWGKINDKTQSTMPARRRFLVFILVSREAAARLCAFAPLRETREWEKHFTQRRKGYRKAQRKPKIYGQRGESRAALVSNTTTSYRSSSRPRAFQTRRCRLYQTFLWRWRRQQLRGLPVSSRPPTGCWPWRKGCEKSL